MSSRFLVVSIVALCLACGARASLGTGGVGPGDAAATVTLSVPLGAYSDCTSSLVTTAPNFVGASGGDGGLTLAQQGDRVVATFAFKSFANGSVEFSPASTNAASFATGQFETADFNSATVVVSPTTGSLVVVGGTLFISVHGTASSGDVSAYFHCPVPTALPIVTVTAGAPSSQLAPGVYGSCTSTVGGTNTTISSGGNGSVTVVQSGSNLIAQWDSDGLTPVCKTLTFLGTANGDATLMAGQTCDVPEPCGPPPSLGTSPGPSDATMTNTAGAMSIDGPSLFINVVGDTTPETCGQHYLSILCAK